MKIYTKTGDQGQTSIIGGRVAKDDLQVEAYGTVDEANSTLGVAVALIDPQDGELISELENIQHELFDCGSDLSMKAGAEEKYPYKVTEQMVASLEEKIDTYMAEAPALERFILPGGTPLAAQLHVVRTVVRRAERRVVRLAGRQTINPYVRQYLNRLSDYLFALSRVVNARAGRNDVEYVRSAKVFQTEQGNDQQVLKQEGERMAKLTFYWYPKCSTCRKAKVWLEEQGHQLELVHLVEQTPDRATLETLWKRSGVELKQFFNTSGQKYRALNLKEKLADMSTEEQLDLLASAGMLIKRPIVTDGEKITLGFKSDLFADVWGK